MKNLKISILAAAVVISLSLPLAAHEEHEKAHKSGASEPASDSIPGLWHEIKEHEKHLGETIEAGRLGEVHEIAFTIRDLTKSLLEKSAGTSGVQIGLVTVYVGQVAEVAELLDQYGDAGDKAKTEEQFARLGELLRNIEAQYPAEMLSLSEGQEVHSHEHQ